mgnify:CR=1 FL=1
MRLVDFVAICRHRVRVVSQTILGVKSRFAAITVFIMVSKILGAILIYERLSQMFGQFRTRFIDMWGQGGPTQPWLYLFSGWDTGHYTTIAVDWYQTPNYVFFPVYPVLTRLVGAMVGDPWMGAFIISFTFGLGSIPLFQLICEHYMSRGDAFISTMLAMTFPYVFFFTTVSYTESLFLFFTLLTWYLFLQKRMIPSALAASVTTLTKTYGIAIVFPIAVSLLVERKPRKILSIALPVAILLGWMYYLYLRTGDAFAFLTQQRYWEVQTGIGSESARNYFVSLLDFFLGASNTVPRLDFASIAFIVLFGYLVFNVYRVDVPLGIYSIILYLGLLFVGNLYSYPRYFAFIFPVWLTAQGKIRSLLLLSIGIIFFLLSSYAIWIQFIMAGWVS